MRTNILLLAGIAAVTIFPIAVQAQDTTTPAVKHVQPYHRLQQVAILTATAPVGEGKKPLSPYLETAAINALSSRFSLPPFARVAPGLVDATLTGLKSAHKKPLAELPASEILAALKVVGEATKADRVVYVLVKEATSKQVALQIWETETATRKMLVNGTILRRSWDDYPVVKNTPDGGISSSVTMPPLSAEAQSRLVTRMISEWHSSENER